MLLYPAAFLSVLVVSCRALWLQKGVVLLWPSKLVVLSSTSRLRVLRACVMLFQVVIPGPSGIVPSSLTDGAPVSSNCPRAAFVVSTQLRVRWNGCGKEQGQNYENCRCRGRETGYAFATRRWTWYQTIFKCFADLTATGYKQRSCRQRRGFLSKAMVGPRTRADRGQ